MNFKLGEKYIVDVTENGIIPLMKFDRDRWYDKDSDNLDFLTDEEKKVVVNEVLDEIRAETEKEYLAKRQAPAYWNGIDKCLQIINKYKIESEDKDTQKDDEIHVGDEVIIYGTERKGVVTRVFKNGVGEKKYRCVNLEGDLSTENEVQKPIKTGRHFDQIEEVLKAMGGE